MTYRELFESSLTERIEAGGDAQEIVNLVNAYQGTDSAARSAVFREWLEGERFLCGQCEMQFSGRGYKVEERDMVFCVWCLKGYRLGEEPVPGFRRALVRRW